MTVPEGRSGHVALNRRYWDEQAAGWHGPLARGHWSRTEQTWGLWNVPESQVRLFPDDMSGLDVIELGCGTAYVSAWLARAGAHDGSANTTTRSRVGSNPRFVHGHDSEDREHSGDRPELQLRKLGLCRAGKYGGGDEEILDVVPEESRHAVTKPGRGCGCSLITWVVSGSSR